MYKKIIVSISILLFGCDEADKNTETQVIFRENPINPDPTPAPTPLEPNISNIAISYTSNIGELSLSFFNNSISNKFKLIVSEGSIADNCSQSLNSYELNDSNPTVNTLINVDLETLYNIKLCTYNSEDVLNEGYSTTFNTQSICDYSKASFLDNKIGNNYYICNSIHLNQFNTLATPADLNNLHIKYSIDANAFTFKDIEDIVIDFHHNPVLNLTQDLFNDLTNTTVNNLILEDIDYSGSTSLLQRTNGDVYFNNLYFKNGEWKSANSNSSVLFWVCDIGSNITFNNIHFGKNFTYIQNFNEGNSALLVGSSTASCSSINLNNVYIGSHLRITNRYDNEPSIINSTSNNISLNNVFFDGSLVQYNNQPFTIGFSLAPTSGVDLGNGILYIRENITNHPFDFSGVSNTAWTLQSNGFRLSKQIVFNPSSVGGSTLVYIRNHTGSSTPLNIDVSNLNKLKTPYLNINCPEIINNNAFCYIRVYLIKSSPQDMETITVNGFEIEIHFVGNHDNLGIIDGVNIVNIPFANTNDQSYLEGLGFDFDNYWYIGEDYPYVYRN